MGLVSWSGSIAQPLTSTPPAVAVATSSEPNGLPPMTVTQPIWVLTDPLPTLMA